MTTSGNTAFDPAFSDLVLDAFDRIQIRPAALTIDHMMAARREANLLLTSWSNRGPNLWVVDEQDLAITEAGGATYTLPSDTVSLFEVFIHLDDQNDRIMMPVSRTEYASFPDKTTVGQPNVYWFNRQITPQITFWQPPDGDYTVHYYRMRQIQTAALAGGTTMELPYRWFDAFVAGMSHRLARRFKPELEQIRKGDYDEAYGIAAAEDTEGTPLYITPGLGGYFR